MSCSRFSENIISATKTFKKTSSFEDRCVCYMPLYPYIVHALVSGLHFSGGGGGEGKVGGKELLKCMARYKSVFNNLWWFDLKLGGKSLCPCACIYISAFSPTRSRGTRTPTCSLIKIASLVF